MLILPTPPLFDVPARGNPLEFLDETYLAKTRGMGLPYGENFTILTSTIFTARCTRNIAMRSHVVCLSVCPSVCLSVTLVDC